IEVARKGAHLILQRGESADVKGLALFVKRGHWFSADDLAARCPHWRVADIMIKHPDGGLDHFTAIIDLGDDAVSLVFVIECDSLAGPLGWRIPARQIVEHKAAAIGISARDDEAGLVCLLA